MAKELTPTEMRGKRIGGCEIVDVIGAGGMGTVYLATQLALNKKVALKILDSKWAVEPKNVENFLREARLAAKLEDEHIVAIYDVGSDQGFHYIVMQLAKGETLKDRLKRGALELEEALAHIEGAAKGLAVAHSHNITHRDIKPANLMIGDDGIVKILDFGLAKLDRKEEGSDDTTQFVGSVAYMAPEQSEYLRIDARTDVYALGITAFQALTGVLPFRGENNWELLVRHHCEEPLAPSVVNSEVPLTMSRVVLKMIAKDPAQRYETIEDVLTDLKLIRRHQLPAAEAPWGKRPLNPAPVDLQATRCDEVYRRGLRQQRDAFRAGKPVKPLREIMLGQGVTFKKSGDPALMPSNFLEFEVGSRRQTLAQVVARDYKFDQEKIVFAERFELKPRSDRLLLNIKGRKTLSIGDVQRLFDLLETLPLRNKAVAVALPPDYTAQGQDIRWIVDAYNLLDKRGCAFSVIVGSMENHTTFINLGIDSHIKLELELERTVSIELEQLVAKGENLPGSMASELGAAGQLPGAEKLTPSARAMVTQISELISTGDLTEAARVWRRLVSEGVDRASLVKLKPLRHELFEKLLAEGKEAFDQDDFPTATDRFNLLIDLDPGRYEGHYYKGLLLKHEGKLEYAQAFLTQAILAAPDEAELFYHRAIVRSRVNDLDGALRDLDMALDHNPRLTQAYYNRAKLHKRMGHDDLSRHDLKLYEKLKKEQERAASGSSNESGERPPAAKPAEKKK
ncbi:MAG: hypothetical protein DCC64_15660 [Planctomycetota bacterium]|nr:MAG: hypothetical protein DCC64_15660 [Planctomycetota bacterium]